MSVGKLEVVVDKVIRQADILLLVVDARRVQDSINRELESRIKAMNKKLVYVINKCDLITKEEQDNLKKLPNSVQVSAKKHWGTLRLLRFLMRLSEGNEVKVGVIGYPNTGKSSIINALRGRKSAPVSPISGFTKSLRNVRINRRLLMIDAPGLIPYSEKENVSNVIIGAIDSTKIKDPEGAAMELLQEYGDKICKYYEVEESEDVVDTLEKIALKKNMLRKGGEVDTRRMAIDILNSWQRGKIK